MKKWLILLFLVVSLTGFSQKNVAKLGISGIGYGDYSLSYERQITPKSALEFKFGILNQTPTLISTSYIDEDSYEVGLKELNGGFHTSLDYRFYLGKKEAPKGFYIAPYARYASFGFELIDEIDGDYFNVEAKIPTIGLGFQMGYHWIVFDKISIDWYFFGVGVEYLNPKFVYTLPGSSFNYTTIVDNVEDVFDGWSYFQNRLKTKAEKDNMTATLPVFLPGIKTGLTLGYAF